MRRVTVEDAGKELEQIIEQAQLEGEEVIITQGGAPIARLVPLAGTRPRPQFGSAKGMIRMAPDSEAPLADFSDCR